MLRNVFVGLTAALLVGMAFIPDDALAYRGGGARAGGGVRAAGVRGGAVGVAGRGAAYRGAGAYRGRYASRLLWSSGGARRCRGGEHCGSCRNRMGLESALLRRRLWLGRVWHRRLLRRFCL